MLPIVGSWWRTATDARPRRQSCSPAPHRPTRPSDGIFIAHYKRPKLAETPGSRADFGLAKTLHYYLISQYLFKLHPDFDHVIGRILRGDKKGRILLVEGSVPRWSQLLMERFRQTMPDEIKRIQVIEHQSHEDFLALLACVDVSLDTPLFNGGNTTIEALTVGTPVVTLAARSARGRVSSALYKHMGVTDCVADTVDEYVDIAIRLGTKRSFRKKISEKIIEHNHKLFDNSEALREWERFFRESCAVKGIHPPQGIR